MARGARNLPAEGNASIMAPSSAPGAVDPFAETRKSSLDQTVEALQRSAKRIRNSKGRIRRAKFLTEVEMLRMQGFTPKQTADILGCTYQQVTHALTTIRKNCNQTDQLLRLDQIGIPLAVDNALRGIMDGDKDYTTRLLDGRGMFRTHKSIEAQITKTVLEMRVSVVMPDHLVGKDLPVPRPGSIVGAPVTIAAAALPATPEAEPARLVTVETPAGKTIAVMGEKDLS